MYKFSLQRQVINPSIEYRISLTKRPGYYFFPGIQLKEGASSGINYKSIFEMQSMRELLGPYTIQYPKKFQGLFLNFPGPEITNPLQIFIETTHL